jgi:arylsulfatase A-like enzyme
VGSKGRPVFGFINLIDAHEPFFGLSSGGKKNFDFITALSTRQDRAGWLEGKWIPTKVELERLRELYGLALEGLDRRLKGIFGIIKESGFWEDSMIVLTSDHGQSFAAGGTLFHGPGLDDSLLRTILSVHYPGGRFGGVSAKGWASIIDVFPTVLDVTGISKPDRVDGRILETLLDANRPDPVFAMSDGLTPTDRRRVPQSRWAELDQIHLMCRTEAGRVDEREDPLRPENAHRSTGRDSNSPTELSGDPTPQARLSEIRRTVSARVAAQDGSVGVRLDSWGYD